MWNEVAIVLCQLLVHLVDFGTLVRPSPVFAVSLLCICNLALDCSYRGNKMAVRLVKPLQWLGCELDNPGFSSQKYLDRPWGPPNVLFNEFGCHGVFLMWGWSGRGVNLTTHPALLPRLRITGVTPLLPLYDVTACTGITRVLGS